MRAPAMFAECVTSQVAVWSEFNRVNITPSVIPMDQDFPSALVQSKSNYHTVTLPALGLDDIVYARVSGYDQYSALKVTLYKGNHITNSKTFNGVKCENGCSPMPGFAYGPNVAWAGQCWHCGNGAHGTVHALVEEISELQSVTTTLPYKINVKVTSWTPLKASFQKFTHVYGEQSLYFFSAQHARNQASRIEIDVLIGASLEVNVYSAGCSNREISTQYWCFNGARCDIPLPRKANFGSYYRTDGLLVEDSPYLNLPNESLKIVIRSFDSTFEIRQLLGKETCNKLTTTNAPFCSGAGDEVTDNTYWGDVSSPLSFKAKDDNALEFYNNLTKAFMCEVQDHCDCGFQSESCRDWIKIYACQSIFNRCDQKGFEVHPTYHTCRKVEVECKRTWHCAQIPELSCNHSFYQSGISAVSSLDTPLNSLDDPQKQGNTKIGKGYIILIIVLITVVVLALVGAAYILFQRSSSMSSVIFDESSLGQYEAM